MPEVALKGPGLVFKLAVQQLRRFAKFLLPCPEIERKQNPPFVDIVQVIPVHIITPDAAVLLHKGINKGVDKIRIAALTCYLTKSLQSCHHTSVNVVPVRRFALADFFNIPGCTLRS